MPLTAANISALYNGFANAMFQLNTFVNSGVLGTNSEFSTPLPVFGATLGDIANSVDSSGGALTQAQAAVGFFKNLVRTVAGKLQQYNASGGSVAEADFKNAVDFALQQAGVQNTSVTLNLSNPNDIRMTFTTSGGTAIYTADLPTAPGLGMPGGLLKLATAGQAKSQVGWNVNLTIGVDQTGFYIDTSNFNELTAQITAGIPDASFTADLAIAHFLVADEDADSNPLNNFLINQNPRQDDIDHDGVFPSLASLGIGIDFTDPNFDGRLRDTEIAAITAPGNLLRATLNGFADLNLHFEGNMGTSLLPSYKFDLDFDWAFNAAAFGGSGIGGLATFGTLPTLAFKNAQLDAGSLFNNFLKPITFNLATYLEPVRQLMDALRTELSVLELLPGSSVLDVVNANTGQPGSDGHIHVLDLIAKADPDMVDPELIGFFHQLDQVFYWAGFLTNHNYGPVYYNIGSFDLFGIDLRAEDLDLATVTPRVTAQLENLENFTDNLLGGPLGDALKAWFPQASGDAPAPTSFQFPFFTDPLSFAKFILGQDVDLFRVDLPKLTFGFGSLAHPIEFASIPVVPFVEAVLEGFANVTIDLDFGFDTSGIQNWLQNGGPVLQFLDGLWLSDHTESGTDLPEIVFTAGINALARVNAGFAQVAIGGGILGAVELDLKDPTPDGRVYLPELLTTSNFGANPLGVFNTGGRITAGFTAYVSALNGYFEWRYNSPRVTLFDMTNTDNSTGNPHLGSMSGGVLTLNVGAFANQRTTSDHVDNGESVAISPVPVADSIAIGGFGATQIFTGVTSIEANGGAYGDDLDALSRPALFNLLQSFPLLPMTFSGGAGNDHLGGGDVGDTLDGGPGSDFLEGRNGSDVLLGGDGDDILDGGPGPDVLNGGAGNDVAAYQSGGSNSVIINLSNPAENAGEALGDTFISIESIRGTANDDIITGDGTGNTFFGDAGNDILNGGAGDDVLSGDAGGDVLNGGPGIDLVSYLQSPGGVTVDLVNGSSGNDAQGDTYNSIERIVGSAFGDTLSGDDLSNYLGGNNGDDTLYGRGGDDNLQGENGDDTLYGDDGHDILAGGAGADTFYGGDGIDTVTYEDSPQAVGVNLETDYNYNGHAAGDVIASDVESVIGSAYNDGITGDEQNNFLYGNNGDDDLTGGAGDDFLIGGPGADDLFGGTGTDTASYFSAPGGVTVNLTTNSNLNGEAQGDILIGIENLDGSEFADTLTGDSQRNTLTGRAGMDVLDGAGGDDLLIGGAGPDVIYGGAGIDTLSYASSPAGVTVNVVTNVNTGGDAQGDLLAGDIEVFVGSLYNDSFTGNGLDNLFISSPGADQYYGGGGSDTLTYEGSPSAVSIDLTMASQSGGHAQGDFIANDINKILGSIYDDSIIGDGDANVFDAGIGNDSVHGGDGADTIRGGAGADSMTGGAGTDTLSYLFAPSGVAANLGLGFGTAGEAAGDSFSTFENVEGSQFDDFLYGDGGVNLLTGHAGNDYLDGAAGADVGSSRVDLQACKLEYSIVSPK